MTEEEEETIRFEDLTKDAQQEIIDADPDEKLVWYAKKEGNEYEVRSVEYNLLGLLKVQGGMGPGWMRVNYSRF